MRPRCHKCAYDLSGIRPTAAGICPECGVTIDWKRACRTPIDRNFWWQISTMLLAYGLLWTACFAPMLVPRRWISNADALDGLIPIIPVIYSPAFSVGVILSVLGYVSRRRKQPRPRATWTWISSGLVSAIYFQMGVRLLWYLFGP